jgi:acetyl esterase/lipase
MKKILAVVFVVLLILIIVGVIVVNRSIVHIQLPHHAILHVLPASKNNHARSAIILCPGGGYRYLEKWNEGYMWFPFFYLRGYTVAMLEYRMPKLNRQAPIIDGSEAVWMMRKLASEWGYDENNVGVMGFSAGAHVASTLLVNDKVSARPDFGILFYPVISMKRELTLQGTHDNLLGWDASEELEDQYSNELHVSDNTPPVYIVVASNDKKVNPGNSFRFYDEMRAKNRPATLRVFPSFEHGWGYHLTFDYHSEMMDGLIDWLQDLENKKVE